MKPTQESTQEAESINGQATIVVFKRRLRTRLAYFTNRPGIGAELILMLLTALALAAIVYLVCARWRH